MKNSVVGQGYTIPVCAIVNQIWADGHPDEEIDTLDVPSWKEGLAEIDEHITYAVPEIFSFDYPYYGDQTDKLHLEKHILETYYTRDICSDSVLRWILFLKDRLNDVMPRYVELYNAQVKLIESDILNPYHLQEDKKTKSDKATSKSNISNNSLQSEADSLTDAVSSGMSNGTDTTQSKDVNKASNTPQAMAQAVDSGDEIALSYLSSMATNKNDTENAYSSQNESADKSSQKSKRNDESSYSSLDNGSEAKKDDMIRNVKGNLSKMNNAQLIKDYQDVILNIENMITNELRDLFYQIY